MHSARRVGVLLGNLGRDGRETLAHALAWETRDVISSYESLIAPAGSADAYPGTLPSRSAARHRAISSTTPTSDRATAVHSRLLRRLVAYPLLSFRIADFGAREGVAVATYESSDLDYSGKYDWIIEEAKAWSAEGVSNKMSKAAERHAKHGYEIVDIGQILINFARYSQRATFRRPVAQKNK